MKFICLGFFDETLFNALPANEQATIQETCMAYDEELIAGGNFSSGHALSEPGHAVTVRPRNGGVAVTDGPFAETKEFLGGILILEARDLNHAIQLMSRHPGVKMGGFEIRPVHEAVQQLIDARVQRHQK